MPTARRLPGRTTRGTRTDINGTPTDCTSTPTEFSRDPTGITVTPAASTATARGITGTGMGIWPPATGTTPPAITGLRRGRAFSPTGTVTAPEPGTFTRSTARAPTTVTDPDPSLPAAC